MNFTDKDQLIHILSNVIDALTCIVGQNIEVILHDLSQPKHSIIKILNGHVSGRKLGSSVLQSPESDLGFLGLLKDEKNDNNRSIVFKNYKTKSASGKLLTSSSIIYKDHNHEPVLAICFNADQQSIEFAQQFISQLLPKEQTLAVEDTGYTLQEKINSIIKKVIPPAGILQSKVTKKEKIHIVKMMKEHGLFLVRGGMDAAAKALGVTRYTIYNYLDEVKKIEEDTT